MRPAHRASANPIDGATPFLKWAGGKRRLLKQYAPFFPARATINRYYEPFIGSAAVFFHLQPPDACLADVNEQLVEIYQVVQGDVEGLIRALKVHRNERDYYYEVRALDPDTLSPTERAGRLIFLNRTCYNGLCRFNRSGEFNVPFGRYRSIKYTRDFGPYRDRLAGWEFSCRDFEALGPEDDDFVYADPPYDVEFRQYAQGGFEWDDQVRLAHWLARHPGPVVASNQATERILELYSGLGFAITLLDAPRMISCTGDRSPAREMLATRNMI